MVGPLVSIIVPIYNTAKYLPKCLDSLINQSYKNMEIICVNNGSTDGSNEILENYKYKDNRIRIINTTNEGVSNARNEALKHIKGDYLMFVDSDDWIEIDTCQTVIKKVVKCNVDVVMWSYIREFSNKSLPKEIFRKQEILFEGDDIKKIHRRFIGLVDEELADIECADALCPVWGKLYKTSIIRNNGIIFTDIRKIGTYEDGLFNLEVFQYVEKALFINCYYYHYRKSNNSSITSKYNQKLYINWLNLYAIMKNYINHNKLDNRYRKALNNRISIGILGLGLNILKANISHIKKIKLIKQIISSKQYREAIKELDLKYFPIQWKVFYFCAKRNMSMGIYILMIFINKIINS